MFEGFDDEAKAAIAAAHAAAERFGAIDTGSEHLLLGIVTTDSATARILAGLRVTPEGVEHAIVPRREGQAVRSGGQWSPACRSVFATCLQNRLERGDRMIGIGYLALAITEERYGQAASILAELTGASPAAVRDRLMLRLGIDSWNEPEPSRWPSLSHGFKTDGLADPREVALRGFAPEVHAYIAEIRYKAPDHALVSVGFPGTSASYLFNIFRHDDGWRMDTPEGREV